MMFEDSKGEAAEQSKVKAKVEKLTDTRRKIEFLELGGGETPAILVHGFLGSGKIYEATDSLLKHYGIRAIAPNLYGSETDWEKRSSVMDAGRDIAALSNKVHGAKALPAIVSCSAGVKEGIAACIALNEREGVENIPSLDLISGQVDMTHNKAWSLLSGEERYKLNAILGVAKDARIPAFQIFRNAGARLKQRVAHRKVSEMAHTHLVADEILGKLSAPDRKYLEGDKEFKTVLLNCASAYSYGEIIESIESMFGWNLDLAKLVGTKVKITHGTEDKLVHPDNAKILEGMLRKAGVKDVSVEWYPDGHLLLKVRAEEIVKRIADGRTH